MSERPKDATRVAAGLKAAIHNPHVGNEARQRAVERLKGMGQEVETSEETQHSRHEHHEQGTEDPSRVIAGYKATITNPRTSPEAKKHAEEVLHAAGILDRHPGHSDEEHQTRVIGGYKAALRNPRVSEEAKQHAREYLEEHAVEV